MGELITLCTIKTVIVRGSTTEPETILDDEQKNDYTAFDGLISKMNLTVVIPQRG